MVIWYRIFQTAKEETCFHHYVGYSFQLEARDLLYASSHMQDITYHGLCHTNCKALAGMKYLNGSTMMDRSNDLSHREWMLYHRGMWLGLISDPVNTEVHSGNLVLPLHGLLFLIAASYSQDSTYHCLCYTSCGAIVEARNSSVIFF